jgi:hypothetical protein
MRKGNKEELDNAIAKQRTGASSFFNHRGKEFFSQSEGEIPAKLQAVKENRGTERHVSDLLSSYVKGFAAQLLRIFCVINK